MSAPRLTTELRVKAAIRQAMVDGSVATVLCRGDATAGAVLVRLSRLDGTCWVLAETQTATGERAWLRGTGEAPVDDATADAYVARHRARDPDLWVVEVEDRQGRLPFAGPVVAA